MTTSRHRSGFTLVEILVVVAVIIVLAAIAVPAISTMFKGRTLSGSVQSVKDMFSLARGRAAGRPVLLRFVPHLATVTGKDLDDLTKTTDVVRWKIEIVDSDGDGDGVTNENPGGDAWDFAPWTSFPDMTDHPDTSKVPPTALPLVAIRAQPHSHAPLDPEDDRILESVELPAGFSPRPGSAWGTTNAVFIFSANGTCRIARPDTFAPLSPVDSSSFKTDPAANHDFRITTADGEAYFDLLPTGLVLSVEKRD